MQTTLDNEANDLLLPTFDYNNTTTENTDPEHTMAMTLLRTVIPMIVLMGTVGNTLSFCVLVRRNMRSTPMYFYLTLLAVADTFVLYVSAFKVWIRALTQFEVLHMSNVGCKLFMFILLCSFYLSAWLVVLVTLDRFLVVWFPFRGYLLMRIRRARLTALVLAVIVAVYNFHVFWTISLHRYGSSLMCDASEDNFFMMHVFEYLKLVSYCVVPFIIVVALNVGILVKINRVYSNTAVRRHCGHMEAAPGILRRRPCTDIRRRWWSLCRRRRRWTWKRMDADWSGRSVSSWLSQQSTRRHQHLALSHLSMFRNFVSVDSPGCCSSSRSRGSLLPLRLRSIPFCPLRPILHRHPLQLKLILLLCHRYL